MLKVLLFFFAFSSWAPVLNEGRYQPYGTLPKEEQNLKQLQAEGRIPFSTLEEFQENENKPYQRAHGKALYYPTEWQLKAELFLHYLPVKWILIITYLMAAFFRKTFIHKQLEKLGIWQSRYAGLDPAKRRLKQPASVGISDAVGSESVMSVTSKNQSFKLFVYIPFGIHTCILLLNCFILRRPPVSNMTETILYVPWVAVLVSFFFKKEREGALVAAILLFFLPSHFHLENVQAVLDSQIWLLIHVLMVVGSYGIFFFAAILGHIYLFKQNSGVEQTLLRALYIGTTLLISGTILGGVWAAQSWGRFWDWDPKEAWAFISSGIYLIWLHAYKFKKITGRGLAIGSIVGLLAITFTWYGVNYILAAGLHSYGFGSGGETFYYLYLGAELLFIIFFIYKNWRIEKKEPRR